MSEYPTYKQSRFGAHRKFVFGLDSLGYCARDYSGEYEYSTPYETIQVLEPISKTLNSINFVRKLFLTTHGALGRLQVGAAMIMDSLLSRFTQPQSKGHRPAL
jgi:hypothetical protein